MKWVKTLLTLALALCLALAGCGGDQEAAAPSSDASSQASSVVQEAAPTSEPTPEPTPEPVKWVEASYKGLILSVPDYWEKMEGNDYLGFSCTYDDRMLKTKTIPADRKITEVMLDVHNLDYKLDAADFDQELTWNEETMSALRKADIKETDRLLGILKPDPKDRSIDEMLIDGQPATVYGEKTDDGDYWERADYLTGIEGKYVSISIFVDSEASAGTRKAFDADVKTMLESIQLSGIPAVAQREAALGEPRTLLKTENTESETIYWAVAPKNFSDAANSRLSSGMMIWDFLEQYPISGVDEDEDALKIVFVSAALEKQYSFSFDYGVLKLKEEADMTVEEIEALIPSGSN